MQLESWLHLGRTISLVTTYRLKDGLNLTKATMLGLFIRRNLTFISKTRSIKILRLQPTPGHGQIYNWSAPVPTQMILTGWMLGHLLMPSTFIMTWRQEVARSWQSDVPNLLKKICDFLPFHQKFYTTLASLESKMISYCFFLKKFSVIQRIYWALMKIHLFRAQKYRWNMTQVLN